SSPSSMPSSGRGNSWISMWRGPSRTAALLVSAIVSHRRGESRRGLQNLEATAAIHPQRMHQIGAGFNKADRVTTGVEVLDGHSVWAQRRIDQIGRTPLVRFTIQDRLAPAIQKEN